MTVVFYLGRKREGEANVEEDEEDEREEFLAKLVVILFVRELVGVFHESIGDCGQEGGGSCGGPQIVQGRVALKSGISLTNFLLGELGCSITSRISNHKS